MVNQIFGSDKHVRGTIPQTVEFPLRASTTAAELDEFYSVRLSVSPDSTLGEIIRHELQKANPLKGESIQLGPLVLRVLRLTPDGSIDMVGMTILPDTVGLLPSTDVES